MSETVVTQVINLIGVPNNFAGWVLLYAVVTILFVVFVVLLFSLPFILFGRR